MAPKASIIILGAKQAGIKMPEGAPNHATIAITITASGKMLQEVVVFKRKLNRTFSKKEFCHHKEWHGGTGVYACQESAWMDKEVINLWIQAVLEPYF